MLFIDEELTFIHPDDVDLYNSWDSRAFELQVANHELLGHGSGKQFEEYADGTKNFDPEKVLASTNALISSAPLTLVLRSPILSLGNQCVFGLVRRYLASLRANQAPKPQHIVVQTWPNPWFCAW